MRHLLLGLAALTVVVAGFATSGTFEARYTQLETQTWHWGYTTFFLAALLVLTVGALQTVQWQPMNRTTLFWLRGVMREVLRRCWCLAAHRGRNLQPTNCGPDQLVCGWCGMWHDHSWHGTERIDRGRYL